MEMIQASELRKLADLLRWARRNGWCHHPNAGWWHPTTGTLIDVAVTTDGAGRSRYELGVAVGATTGHHHARVQRDRIGVQSVGQAIDVLCALGVLPDELSRAYGRGMALGRHDLLRRDREVAHLAGRLAALARLAGAVSTAVYGADHHSALARLRPALADAGYPDPATDDDELVMGVSS